MQHGNRVTAQERRDAARGCGVFRRGAETNCWRPNLEETRPLKCSTVAFLGSAFSFHGIPLDMPSCLLWLRCRRSASPFDIGSVYTYAAHLVLSVRIGCDNYLASLREIALQDIPRIGKRLDDRAWMRKNKGKREYGLSCSRLFMDHRCSRCDPLVPRTRVQRRAVRKGTCSLTNQEINFDH